MSKFNFYKESMLYMRGYPKWLILMRMPKAYIKFKWISRHDN